MHGIYAVLAVHLIIAVVCLGAALVLMLRKRRGAALGALLAAPVAMLAWFGLSSRPSVAAVLYDSDTVYAEGFSPAEFAQVRAGDSLRSVEQNLGRPLKTTRHSGEIWMFYSRRGSKKSHWTKIVVVDAREQRVRRVIDDFYRD